MVDSESSGSYEIIRNKTKKKEYQIMVHAVFHESDGTLEELLANEGGHDVLHFLFVSDLNIAIPVL